MLDRKKQLLVRLRPATDSSSTPAVASAGTVASSMRPGVIQPEVTDEIDTQLADFSVAEEEESDDTKEAAEFFAGLIEDDGGDDDILGENSDQDTKKDLTQAYKEWIANLKEHRLKVRNSAEIHLLLNLVNIMGIIYYFSYLPLSAMRRF